MNEEMQNLKVYSEALAKELTKKVSKLKIKEVSGEGEFEVIASNSSIDRDGESIDVNGWDLTNWLKNPVILWGHNYWEMDCVIGAGTDAKIVDGQLIIKGVFAKTEAGQYVRQLYDDGIIKTVSVGFIVKERNGNVITKQELLEVSFVPVPANPEALAIAKALEAGKAFETKFLKIQKGEDSPEDGQEDKPEPKAEADENATGEEQEPVKMTRSGLAKLKADLVSIIDARVIVVEDKKEAPGAKAGRVISAKNRELVQAALDAVDALKSPLKALLDAADGGSDEEGKRVDMDSIKSLMQSADGLIGEALKKFKSAKK